MPIYLDVVNAATETVGKILTHAGSPVVGRAINVTTEGGNTASVFWTYAAVTVNLPTLPADALLTRAGASNGAVTDGISLRRLFAWAEMLSDGIDAETAFRTAVLNAASEQDRETLRQQCLLAYDKAAVARALDPDAAAIADAELAAAAAAAAAEADNIPLAN